MVIIAAVAGAMILPLAMMGYSAFQEARHREVSNSAKAVVESLRQSVEAAADKEWGKGAEAAAFAENMEVFTADPVAEASRIRAMVSKLGGDTIYATPIDGDGFRLLVRIPESQGPVLRSQIFANESVPAAGKSDSVKTLEIILKKRTP